MTLDSMVQDASSGLFVPPQARRPVIPWDDLQALSTPTANAQISPDLISALAILVAQSKDKARLVSADAFGRLLTTTNVNPVTTLSQPYHSGDLVVHVVDSSAFFPTQAVSLISATPGGFSCLEISVQSVPNSTTVKLNNDCAGQSYVVGDYLVGTPTITGPNNLLSTDVSDRAARQLGVVNGVGTVGSVGWFSKSASGAVQITAAVDNLNQIYLNVRSVEEPPNSFTNANFAPTQTPSIVLSAFSGLAIDLKMWSSTIANVSGAAAATAFVTVVSTGTGGTTLWREHLGVPNVVGSSARCPSVPTRLVALPGQGMTISWDIAVPAGYGAEINACFTYH